MKLFLHIEHRNANHHRHHRWTESIPIHQHFHRLIVKQSLIRQRHPIWTTVSEITNKTVMWSSVRINLKQCQCLQLHIHRINFHRIHFTTDIRLIHQQQCFTIRRTTIIFLQLQHLYQQIPQHRCHLAPMVVIHRLCIIRRTTINRFSDHWCLFLLLVYLFRNK